MHIKNFTVRCRGLGSRFSLVKAIYRPDHFRRNNPRARMLLTVR